PLESILEMPQGHGIAVKARVRVLERAESTLSIPQKMQTPRWDHPKERVHILRSGRRLSLHRKSFGTAGTRFQRVDKAICVDRETRSPRAPFLERHPEWRGLQALRM